MINNIDRLVNYKNDIEYSSADYIEGLLNKDDIYHTNIFNGMLKQIYIDVFKNNPLNFNNSNDISLINDLWDIYALMCYKYKQIPNILRFNTLLNCGITMNKIQKIYSEYVNNIDNNNYAANSIIDDSNINSNSSNINHNSYNSIDDININNCNDFNTNIKHSNNNYNNSMYNNSNKDNIYNNSINNNSYKNDNVNNIYVNSSNSNSIYNYNNNNINNIYDNNSNVNNIYDNSNVNNIRSLYYNLSEKILNECEAGAYDLATTGNKVGGMFALKTQYHYVEATQPVHIKADTKNVLTERELKQLINKLQ